MRDGGRNDGVRLAEFAVDLFEAFQETRAVGCSPLLGHRWKNLDFLRRLLPHHRGVPTWRGLTILMNRLNQSDTVFGVLYRLDDASPRNRSTPNWKP